MTSATHSWIPWRIAVANLTLWGVGMAVLTALYGRYDTRFIAMLAPTLSFCGLLVATCAYLFAEFALRPVAALALAAGPPPHRLAPGIMGRTLTVWMLGSGVPVVGIGLTAFFFADDGQPRPTAAGSGRDHHLGRHRGDRVHPDLILAWLTATPVRIVRSALKRVEEETRRHPGRLRRYRAR